MVNISSTKHKYNLAIALFLQFLLLSLFQSCSPQKEYADLRQDGYSETTNVSNGMVTDATIKIDSSNGGPAVAIIKSEYPANAILNIDISASCEGGTYEIVFSNSKIPPLKLNLHPGKPTHKTGQIGADSFGNIPYTIASKNAKHISIKFSFSQATTTNK